MAGGFANPVVNAAGTLIRTLMKSANFVTGLAGWQITKLGDAEFNQGLFRGSLLVGPASPAPRFVVGAAIPAPLLALAPNATFDFVLLFYHNATDFYWEAMGTFFAVRTFFRGNYDTVNGVFVWERVLQAAPGTQDVRFGSAAFNPFNTSVQFQKADVAFMSGTGSLSINTENFTFDGVMAPRGLRASVDSVANSAAIGIGETTVLTLPATAYFANRAYAFEWRGGMQATAAGAMGVRVRKTNPAGQQLNVFGWQFPAAQTLYFYEKNTFKIGAADLINVVLVLTLQAGAGTITHVGAAGDTRYLRVWNIGAAADYPNAPTLI